MSKPHTDEDFNAWFDQLEAGQLTPSVIEADVSIRVKVYCQPWVDADKTVQHITENLLSAIEDAPWQDLTDTDHDGIVRCEALSASVHGEEGVRSDGA